MTFDLQETLKRSKAGASTLLVGLDEIRKQLVIEKEELHRTRNQPVDRKTAAARLDAWLENEPAGAFVKAFAHRFMHSNYRDPSSADASAVLFVAAATAIRETVMAHMDADYAFGMGLSEEDRRQKLSDHGKRILCLELAEEVTIREAEQAGLDILRRQDADANAVLAVDEELVKWL